MSASGGARMLGRVACSLHNHPGYPCGECPSGWPLGRRAQKIRERRQWKREIERDRSAAASGPVRDGQ